MHSPGFELFDHTADVGVRVVAPSREALIAPAIDGLYATIGELVPAAGEPASIERIELAGDDEAYLLRDLLQRLLLRFETAQLLATDVRVGEFGKDRLRVDVVWRALDRQRSALLREVKAVTYHELQIESSADGHSARFIVDI